MSRTLTASDRRSLIRLASTLPKGSPERKAILAGLSKKAFDWPSSHIRARESELRTDETFVRVVDSASGENVFVLLVEYLTGLHPKFGTQFRVEVYRRRRRHLSDLIADLSAPRGEDTYLRPYVILYSK